MHKLIKKLNLQLGSIKEMLTKEQMKKVAGGYDCITYNFHCFVTDNHAHWLYDYWCQECSLGGADTCEAEASDPIHTYCG